jgi:hypothetical protein
MCAADRITGDKCLLSPPAILGCSPIEGRHLSLLRRGIPMCLLGLSGAVLMTPALVAAQTTVRVEASGVPVAAAEVSLWDTDGRVAFGRTDGDGSLRIVPERAVGPAAFLLVRRLGFAPARLTYQARDSFTVSLTAVPTSLPVLSIRTSELRCPSATEPEADSIWRASANRYSLRGTQFRIDWTGYTVNETVTTEQRGYPDPYEMRPPMYGTIGSMRGQTGLENPPPYALYERHIALGGEYWQWRYAAVESFSSDHFLSDRFREQHTMTVLGRNESTTIIGFCPRDDSQADLRGEMEIGVNSLLTGARWFFHVPHDDEDAGGEAAFAPTTYGGHEYLVAIRGTSWRRAGKNLYNQRRFERVRWELHRRD